MPKCIANKPVGTRDRDSWGRYDFVNFYFRTVVEGILIVSGNLTAYYIIVKISGLFFGEKLSGFSITGIYA